MGQVAIAQRHDGGSQGRRITGVEGGVSLAILVAETNHHNVRAFDKRADADGIEPGTLTILPEGIFLLAQDRHAASVAGRVIRYRAQEFDRLARVLGTALDAFALSTDIYAASVSSASPEPTMHRLWSM